MCLSLVKIYGLNIFNPNDTYQYNLHINAVTHKREWPYKSIFSGPYRMTPVPLQDSATFFSSPRCIFKHNVLYYKLDSSICILYCLQIGLSRMDDVMTEEILPGGYKERGQVESGKCFSVSDVLTQEKWIKRIQIELLLICSATFETG